MENTLDMIQLGFTFVGGVLGAFFGGFDGFLYALVIFAAADYITGVLAACKRKELSSEIGFWGIVKKLLIFVIVAIANVIDTEFIKSGSAVRTAVIFFYISNEGVSIIENVVAVGLPVPEKLKEVLAQMRDKEDGDKNENK